MKLVTVSGPPSSGKTSVVLKTIEYLKRDNLKIGIIKFDCLATFDDQLYAKAGVPVKVGLSGNLCPDHFFVSNIEDCVEWGAGQGFDLLISESAGLCNRCSPHIRDILAICVVDCLSGINTPKKIGPMLKLSDIVIITKGDIVSQAEREVFASIVRQANPRATIIFVNGITGQGAFELSVKIKATSETLDMEEKTLKYSMPMALCSYCLGHKEVGREYQMGNIKKMTF